MTTGDQPATVPAHGRPADEVLAAVLAAH